MRNLTRIGSLRGDAIVELGVAEHAWRLRELQLHADATALELLVDDDVADKLPDLHTLVLTGGSWDGFHSTMALSDCARFMGTKLWRRLDVLHLATSASVNTTLPFPPASAGEWMTTPMHVPLELAFGSVGESGAPAGAWLHLHRGKPSDTRFRAVITSSRLARFGLENVCNAIAALPPEAYATISELSLRPSRWFLPTELDLAQVFDLCGLRARIET